MNMQEAFQELQSLDTQNPGAWPQWVHVFFSALLAVALIGGGLWFLVKPKTEELERVQRVEEQLRTDFEHKQQRAAALDAYREQLAEMERSFGDMLRQLPSRAEVANLLNDISQTRVAAALEEELFQPQSEAVKEFYAEMPNRIVVVGDYHEMAVFVSGVAALPRIVTIENVEIQPVAAARARGAPAVPAGKVRMTAIAKTYRYLDEAELAAQQAARQPAARRGGRR